jgi:hypothetical protein
MERDKYFTVGIFDDDAVILKAVEKLRAGGIKIFEVYSPFAIHGMDGALGYKRSRLPKAAFVYGLMGTTLALFTMIWMLGFDWPMIIGGKNFASLPPLIPVTFEFTVLLAAHGMVLTFFIVGDLKPFKKPRLFDARCTHDKFVMAIDLADNKLSKEEINSLLTSNGASEVKDKNF